MRKLASTNFENQKRLESLCGLPHAMEVLKGRWKVNILWSISLGNKRYGEIKKDIGFISEKMLTQRLRESEADGLIIRKDFQTIPPHVEYYLTEIGTDLIPVLDQLCKWGYKARNKNDKEISEH
ncbi:helix-turn-helix transcriptional regulator [Muricauda sp. 2012CJ35-5]|uniref:Helix-turn-helix transcriptional regulator n=1 Tax=Flagellimonas spongiicola TaxID=2942208 RepID=A0ABT0PTB3_9FLAO|nr:helix-turn-helix domain-containing protein [Allomuricauda spongiicola]MCL6274584.1 helix-turn-helix transcriptional regulator [Allomuricauda spongiicola]